MKGNRTTYDGIIKGLRIEDTSDRNTANLVQSIGCRVHGKALEGYIPLLGNIIDEEYGLDLALDWPFPQVFFLQAGLYIGAKEGLYKVQSLTDNPLVLYEFGTGQVTWPWTAIDIPNYPAFTSKDILVYYDSNAASYILVS